MTMLVLSEEQGQKEQLKALDTSTSLGTCRAFLLEAACANCRGSNGSCIQQQDQSALPC